jgi:hypothetical protein
MDIKKQAVQLRTEIGRRNYIREKLKDLPDQLLERYRSWALAECRAEFARGFALVKLVRNDEVLLFLEYLNTLSSVEAQLQFVATVCKRSLSNDPLEPEEQQILEQYLQFSTVPFLHPSGQLLPSARITPEQAALSNRFDSHRHEKKETLQALMSSLRKVGAQYLGDLIIEKSSALWFEKRVGSGYVVTALEFGGWAQLKYSHTIFAASGARPGTNILTGISILSWMGIGQSTWSWLIPDDLPDTVKSIFDLSGHFFDASTTFLSGLDIPAVEP